MFLCRRVCNVPVVPQVLIFVLCFDSYASVYGMTDVLRGSGNSMPFDWFHFIRTSFAKDIAFPVCKREV